MSLLSPLTKTMLPPLSEPTLGPDQVDQSVDRTPCPAPANFRSEVVRYDDQAEPGVWAGPRYRMTYRTLGQGPPLILVPGIASTYRTYALLLNRLGERFRTVIYDYPGEQQGDGADLARIGHDQLVDDLFGLIDHLKIGRVFLVGLSFGSTIVLKSLHREPRRFPRAVVQGAFASRDFSRAERWALRLGRLVPGNVGRLPLRRQVLTYNSKAEFPALLADRWSFYLDENGRTPIRSLAHRVKLLIDLNLRPILAGIPTDVLLIQGNEDRIVSRRYFDMLKTELPHAEGVILPTVGHQPHLTHAEVMARLIGDWLLPCAPGGCADGEKTATACDARPAGDQNGPGC
jgi:pimeloyl-ACP methyl ester carboxylesterase